jgi:hypothetical protein
MRLEAMPRPDALPATMADPGGLRYRPAGLLRRLARRLGDRHLDHPFDRLRRQRRLPAGRVASCNNPSTPWAMKRACQRQIGGLLPLPVCRWIAILPTHRHSAAQS